MRYSLILATIKNAFWGAESDRNAKGYKIMACEGQLRGELFPGDLGSVAAACTYRQASGSRGRWCDHRGEAEDSGSQA